MKVVLGGIVEVEVMFECGFEVASDVKEKKPNSRLCESGSS